MCGIIKEKKKLLAYCGLYCGDCAGYGGEIAKAAGNLKKVLTRFKFSRTAKSLFREKLKEYDKFSEMLNFITELKCKRICRERKDYETDCEIRKCCIDMGYYACYECDSFEQCEKLKTLEDLHGDSCVVNLKAIKDMGIEKWVKKGKRYWFGSDVDN